MTFEIGAVRYFGRVCLASSFAFIILVTPQLAQGQNPDDVVRVETSLVQLNVGVVDRQGRPVTDLSRESFKIFEDGAPQTVASFETTAAPFSLALLLDVSGSTIGFRQQISSSLALHRVTST